MPIALLDNLPKSLGLLLSFSSFLSWLSLRSSLVSNPMYFSINNRVGLDTLYILALYLFQPFLVLKFFLKISDLLFWVIPTSYLLS
jgi:hypothetical protein